MKNFGKNLTRFFAFIFLFTMGIGFASATCTLNEITSPTLNGYVNGNNYQINFTTTEGLAGTCSADAAQFEAWYVYDSDDDGDFGDQIRQSIGTVSPGGELATYTRSWDTTVLSDGDNTRYRVRVTCASNCTGGPIYLAGGDINSTIGVDNTAPTVDTIETLDTNSNGHIDAVKITFTDTIGNTIKDSTVTASNFDVDGYSNENFIPSGTVSGDNPNDNIIVIGFDESGSFDTDATPTVQYTAGTLTDNYTDGNTISSFGPTASTDAAPAVFVAISNYDVTTDNDTTAGHDGYNDEIYIRLSEAVDDSSFSGYFMGIDSNNDGSYGQAGVLKPNGNIQHGQTDAVDDEYITIRGAGQLSGTNKVGVMVNAGRFQDLHGVDNIHQTVLYTNPMVSDAAAPQIMNVGYQDTGSNPDIDKIVVTYSEDIILNEWNTTDWLFTAGSNDDLGVSEESNAGGSGNKVTLTVDWNDFVTGESGTEPKLEYVASAGNPNSVQDASGNSATDYGPTVINDEASPKEIQTYSIDTDGDGNVDALEIRFSEYIDDSEFDAAAIAGWRVSSDSWTTHDTINSFSTAVSVIANDNDADDNYVRLSFTPSNVSGTAVISREYNSGEEIVDGAGNVLHSGYIGHVTDKASPVPMSQEYLDMDNDGAIDRVRIYYSEEFTGSTLGTTGDYTIVDNDVAINSGGANPSWVAKNSAAKYIQLTVNGAVGDTGFNPGDTTQPTVAYTNASGNNITDDAGNVIQDFGAKTLEDKAAPVYIASDPHTKSLGDGNGNTSQINLRYSEIIGGTNLDTANYMVETVIGTNEIDIDHMAYSNYLQFNLDTNDPDQTTAQMQVYVDDGAVKDANGNEAIGVHDEAITDGAKPIAISGDYEDAVNDDGMVDRIHIQFSEPIDITADEPDDWTLGGTDASNVTIHQVIDMGDELSFIVTGPADDTSLNLSIDYTHNGEAGGTDDTVTDEASTPNALDDFTGLILEDKAAPVLLTSNSTTRTIGAGDGTTARMILRFSEAVSFTGTVNDVIIATLTGGNEIDVSSINGPIQTISLYLSGGDINQTTAQLTLSYANNIVKDSAGNFAIAQTNTAISDDADPIVISQEYRDNNNDGTVDHVYIHYSEEINYDPSANGGSNGDYTIVDNDVAINSGGANPSWVAYSGTNKYVVLTVNGAAGDTGFNPGDTTPPTVAYTNTSTNDITDNAGNISPNFTAVNLEDQAAPVLIDANYEDSDSNGTVERMDLTFSENLDDDVANMTGSTFTITINGATTGEGGAEMIESIATSIADDNSLFVYFTNGIVDSTNEDYEIAIANNKIGDASGNLMGTILATDADDRAAPVVKSITYSDNPANDEDDTTITVVMSEDVSGGVIPNIAIDQQGSVDITITPMTDSGDGVTFSYDYDVQEHDGSNYMDGPATVTISLASDGTNVMTPDNSSSFVIQTISIKTNAIMIDNNNVGKDDTVTITAESTANIGEIADERLVITNQLNNNTCTVELSATETTDGTLGSDTEESISYILDLDDNSTSCIEGGTIDSFITLSNDYKLSIVGQDSIVGNWEQTSGDNSAIINVNANSSSTPDTTAPQFVSSTPSNAATNVSVSAGEVLINYDEVVASYDFSKMKLMKVADNSSVSTTKTSAGNIQFRIGYNELEYNTSYKIVLDEGAVQDASGNLSSARIIYFTTQSATAPNITKLTVNDITNTKFDIEWITDVVADTSEYRIGTYAYGSDTKNWTALSSADHDISGDGVTLNANTTYYYQVRFTKDGETTESVPMKVTTARGANGLYVDSISTVKSTAKYDATNPWTNGWHFRMRVTADNIAEDKLRMKLDNWVSGSNALATSNNVSIIVSSNGGDHNEATIAAGTMVETTYDAGTTVDISGITDGDVNMAGKQMYIDIYVKIPNGQEAGSYSTSYGIANQATDTNWGDLD